MSGSPLSDDSLPTAMLRDAPFHRVLCGVDGSRPSREAVRQALLLAPDERLELVAVADVSGTGPTRQALLSPDRAQLAIDEALAAARAAGVPAGATIVPSDEPAARLLERSRAHDLLVLGTHGHSRAEAIILGTTAGIALHRAAVPVWLARAGFPGPVVAGTSARSHDRRTVELAARLAARFGEPLTLVGAGSGSEPHLRAEFSEQFFAATAILGHEPYVARHGGRPADRILEAARERRAGLVVTGSGGRRGLRALDSVSERIGTHARCSVLVVRPG